MKKIASKNGFVLTGILLAMMLLLLIIPLVIQLQQKDSKDAVSLVKKTKSFHLAEAGIDRGAWKLAESDAIWNAAVLGTAIPNYNDDTIFTDVDGGEYKINFNAGPGSGQVTVIAKGRATGTNDIRAIQAIYSKGSYVGAMSIVGGLTYEPNLDVHWGPVVSYTSMDSPGPSTYYPRKYSAGQIVGRDTTNDSSNGAMPSDDWVTYDYASFYDLGTAPSIKLSDYKTIAENSCVPVLRRGTGSSAAVPSAGPGGCTSGYYPTSNPVNASVKIQKPGGGATTYSFTCSTCVIFLDGTLTSFPNAAWLDVKALVVLGDVDFNAGSTSYTATIPSNASDQYTHSSLSGYFASQGWTDGGSYTITQCGMHGFLYCGGNMSNAGGGSTIAGAAFVVGNASVNTLTVYYDESVASNIVYSNQEMTRSSWDEIKTSW